MRIAGRLDVVVVADLLVLLVADEGVVVVLDVEVVVTLGIHEDLFFAVEVFEAEFVGVGCASAFGTARENAGERVLACGIVLRHVDAVIDGADDDGLVGVAFDEVDEDFVIDARPDSRCPSLCLPMIARHVETYCRRCWACAGGPTRTARRRARTCPCVSLRRKARRLCRCACR